MTYSLRHALHFNTSISCPLPSERIQLATDNGFVRFVLLVAIRKWNSSKIRILSLFSFLKNLLCVFWITKSSFNLDWSSTRLPRRRNPTLKWSCLLPPWLARVELDGLALAHFFLSWTHPPCLGRWFSLPYQHGVSPPFVSPGGDYQLLLAYEWWKSVYLPPYLVLPCKTSQKRLQPLRLTSAFSYRPSLSSLMRKNNRRVDSYVARAASNLPTEVAQWIAVKTSQS